MRHTKDKKDAAPPPPPKSGRPAEGADGDRVSDYQQISLRLPERTKALLDAIAGMTGLSTWRVIEDALAAYVRQLPNDEQKILTAVRERRSRER
jgi:hypothetical protein